MKILWFTNRITLLTELKEISKMLHGLITYLKQKTNP